MPHSLRKGHGRGRIWLTLYAHGPTRSRPHYFTRCKSSPGPLAHGPTAYGHTNMAGGQSTAHTTGGIERSGQPANPGLLAQLLGSQLGKGMFQNNKICASEAVLTLPCAQGRFSVTKGISPSPGTRSHPPTRRPRPALPKAACGAERRYGKRHAPASLSSGPLGSFPVPDRTWGPSASHRQGLQADDIQSHLFSSPR